MIARAALTLALLACLARPAIARAQLDHVVADSETSIERDDTSAPCGECKDRGAGLAGGVGTEGRSWESVTELAADEDQMLTARTSLGVAAHLLGGLDLVVRTAVLGVATDRDRETVALRAPLPSIGLIMRSRCDAYRLEFGVRLALPTAGDASPEDVRLSLRATIVHGAADDAFWLPRNEFGVQLYSAARTRVRFGSDVAAFFLTGEIGATLSTGSLSVGSWLGSQVGFVGSAYVEGSVGLLHLAPGDDVNVRIGVRAELSLSSVWAAGDVLPFTADGFVGWSPESWLAIRLFGGIGGLVESATGEGPRFRYGAQIALYAP